MAARTAFTRSQMGLLMVDMDRLKHINDTFGHVGGDAALRLTAKAIRASVRTSDIVCRYGGDEFVVLLPACTLDGLAAVAVKILRVIRMIDTFLVADNFDDRLQEHVGDFLAIDSADLQQLQRPAGAGVLLSVSIGGAMLPDSAESGGVLVERADSAMYAAKEIGRNRANIVGVPDGTLIALDATAAINVDRPRPVLSQPPTMISVPLAPPDESDLQSRLLSFIGHELRTPLSVMYSYAQIIRDKLPDTPEFARLRTMADKSVAQGDTIVAMIEEVLDASRLQQSRLSLDLNDTDLAVLVEHALLHLDLADPARIACLGCTSATPFVVIADEQRLERTLLTLLAMGIAATDLLRRHQQIVFDSTDPRPDAVLQLRQADESVIFDIYLPSVEVADEQWSRLFDLTYAVNSAQTPTTHAGAIGLGLYVAHGVVALHGGHLTALRPTLRQDERSPFTDMLKTYAAADGTLPGTLFSLALPLKGHSL